MMTIWYSKKLRNQLRKERIRSELHAEIIEGVRLAHADWLRAQRMFEEAVGKDQVDYAIFLLEAAELNYQIQLKRAKQANVHRPDNDNDDEESEGTERTATGEVL